MTPQPPALFDPHNHQLRSLRRLSPCLMLMSISLGSTSSCSLGTSQERSPGGERMAFQQLFASSKRPFKRFLLHQKGLSRGFCFIKTLFRHQNAAKAPAFKALLRKCFGWMVLLLGEKVWFAGTSSPSFEIPQSTPKAGSSDCSDSFETCFNAYFYSRSLKPSLSFHPRSPGFQKRFPRQLAGPPLHSAELCRPHTSSLQL